MKKASTNTKVADRAVLKRTAASILPVLIIGLVINDSVTAAAGKPGWGAVALQPVTDRDRKQSALLPAATGSATLTQQPPQASHFRTAPIAPQFPAKIRFGASQGTMQLPTARTSVLAHSETDLAANKDVSAGAKSLFDSVKRRKNAIRSLVTVYEPVAASSAAEDEAVRLHPDPALPTVVDPANSVASPDLLEGIPRAYTAMVERVAHDEGVDVNLMLSIMRAENSSFNPAAISRAGAIGLMQVTPAVGRAFGATDLTDPAQNIRTAARFLRTLADKYRNPVLIASAYNAGEARVDDRASLPLIRETADYVTKVIGLYTNFRTEPSPDLNRTKRGDIPRVLRSKVPSDGLMRRSRTISRISSSMLVYSIKAKETANSARTLESRLDPAGPPHIEKEK